MSQALWLGLPAAFLSVALVASYGVWACSHWYVTPRLRTATSYAILAFVAHLVEETLSGLYESLPALFDRAPWSIARFLLFNATWLAIFVFAALALEAGKAWPALPLIFLAVAGGVGNGILHLLLVLRQGAYFPGAVTAPICLITGVWLLLQLYRPRVAS